MNILSFFGVILGFGAVLFGNHLDGGHIDSLINVPAFIIVMGGTLGAVCLQFSPRIFIKSIKQIKQVFLPPKLNLQDQISKIVNWSLIARKNGLLDLERFLDNGTDNLEQKGLQLLVDGNEPEIIRESLQVDLEISEYLDLQSAKVFEAMGGYSPTIGIIGAVMGLIHVMQNLSDPALLGQGIATAFVATIYGVGSANLLFLPISQQLKSQAMAASRARELLIEGIVSIAAGENPHNIELKLSGYLQE